MALGILTAATYDYWVFFFYVTSEPLYRPHKLSDHVKAPLDITCTVLSEIGVCVRQENE